MSFNNPDRPASGWNTAVYNGQFSREGIAASMTPEERRAMIQRYEDSTKPGSNAENDAFSNRTTEFGSLFGKNIFGMAANGINKLKGNKKGDTSTSAGLVQPEAGSSTAILPKSGKDDTASLADKKDGYATAKASEVNE